VTSDKGKLGRIQLAQDSIASTKREADKQHTVSRSKLPTNLGKASHGNVVKILGAFMDQNVVSLAYEVMDLTLGQLRYQTGLEEKYISYICREVIHGLHYLHKELQVSQVDVSSENMFLNRAGDVKIANVGSYLIWGNRELKQDSDIRALGFMMMEIMEPETASAKPNVIVLMKPERVAFLKRKGKPLRKKSATQSPERHNMGQRVML
jgi:serine/threonine protein kinase